MSELTEEQVACVERLVAAMNELGNTLVACRENDLAPVKAFRAAGIDIPSFAAPALDMMFRPTEKV